MARKFWTVTSTDKGFDVVIFDGNKKRTAEPAEEGGRFTWTDEQLHGNKADPASGVLETSLISAVPHGINPANGEFRRIFASREDALKALIIGLAAVSAAACGG